MNARLRRQTGEVCPAEERGLPVFGCLPEFLRGRPEFMARAMKLGPVVKVNLPGPDTYIVSEPELIDEVLVTKNRTYQKDAFTRDLGKVIGRGLLTSEGEHWRHRRKLVQPLFKAAQLTALEMPIEVEVRRLAERLGQSGSWDIFPEMVRFTLDLVTKTMLASDLGPDLQPLSDALDALARRFADPVHDFFPQWGKVPTPANLAFERASRCMWNVTEKLVDGRYQRFSHLPSLMDVLRGQTDFDDLELGREALTEEALILLIAGHETTALTLSFTLMLLAQHPDVQRKIQREITAVCGDEDVGAAHLGALTETRAVFYEAMRLYPPAWALGREALHRTSLGGVRIAAGSTVVVPTWGLQRDARFFEEGSSFVPARWHGGLMRQLPKGVYCPFGAGPRMCIGKGVAMLEAQLTVATLLQRFDLRLESSFLPTLLAGITLRPNCSIPIGFSPRSRPAGPKEGRNQ